MPIYTYRCANCSTELDLVQGFDDPPLTQCPKCHEEHMQRVYKPIRVVFKGSGFYATDNRSPSGVTNGQVSKSGESDTSEKAEKTKTITPSPSTESAS
jgi:putative FmdB family regulatory protein